MTGIFEIRPLEKCIEKVKYTTKVASQDFKESGRYPIISQEEAFISGYWDIPEDVFHIIKPVVIFGDHSRHLKYVDFDFVIGADGVKILSPVEDINAKYFYYYLKWLDIPSLGYSRHFKSLKEKKVKVFPFEDQKRIVDELDLLTSIIDKKNAQLRDLDALAQSTFYEMFGDPNTNERGWKYKTLGNACALKAGKGIKASELSEEKAAGLYPCFGGNGIRGYIAKKSHKGTYPIIGRQGALCGNVQLATGEFYATEHAVVCTPGEGLHAVFVYYALLAMNLNQYATGVAQPGLAVKTLLPIPIVTPPMELQERFAEKICNIESQIDLLNVSLEQIDTLFHSRMDYYFND